MYKSPFIFLLSAITGFGGIVKAVIHGNGAEEIARRGLPRWK